MCHGRSVVNKTNCVNDRDIDMGDGHVAFVRFLCYRSFKALIE